MNCFLAAMVLMLFAIPGWAQTHSQNPKRVQSAKDSGQSTLEKPQQWNEVDSKDEMTDIVTTSFVAMSLPPEKAKIYILCNDDGTRKAIALISHFQVRADDEYGQVAVSTRIDDTPREIKGVVNGDLNTWVQLPTDSQILTAAKEIKIRLWEFGADSHIMIFKLKGVAPACPNRIPEKK